MEIKFKPGDLVKYVKHPAATLPRKVIPHGKQPVGVVIDISKKIIGNEKNMQSYMITVLVQWSDTTWNNQNGYSEEHASDLVMVQKAE